MRQLLHLLTLALIVKSGLAKSQYQTRPDPTVANRPLDAAPTTVSPSPVVTPVTTEANDASSTFAERVLQINADIAREDNSLSEDQSQIVLTAADELQSVPDLSNLFADLVEDEQSLATRVGSANQITFGRLNDKSKSLCLAKNVTFVDIVYDEIMQCQMDHEQKCFSTQETTFTSYNTEVCDETFTKVCSISFLQETSPVVVEVCYNKAGKICDDGVERNGRQVDPSTCVDVYETICDTVTRQHVVEDDVADCKQEKQEVCLARDGCPTVPKTKCTITKQNVTKDYTDTQCRKVKKNICGPDECPIRFLPEICTNETRLVTTSIPMEKCELLPKKECREISTLVPGLRQAEKCMEIPKEICSKVQVPRKVNKTTSKLICPDTSLSRGKCTTKNFSKANGKSVCYFFAEEGLTQSAAAARCASLGARLPEIYDANENADIASLMPDTPAYLKGFWLGCTKASDGNFVWMSTGKKVDYFNWYQGEPDNNESNEDCTNMLSKDLIGKWNKIICSNSVDRFPLQMTLCEKIL